MARVVVVHGINNTYSGPRSMAAEWTPALLDGIDLAGYSGSLAADDIGCVFYGDLFRKPGRMLGDEDLAVLGPEDVTDPADVEVLAQWWQAAAEVVVAHSLGSVVAYEGLCAHPEWKVRGLVTLGSPLGIRNVILDRLQPVPRGVVPPPLASWVNIADQADFVALVKRLAPVFGASITDVEIDNGARMHRVTRYLTAKETGTAIAGALRGGQAADGG